MSTPPPPGPEPDQPQPRQEASGPNGSPPPEAAAPDTTTEAATTETPASEASTSAASTPAAAGPEDTGEAAAHTPDTPHGTPQRGYPAPHGQPQQGSPPQGQPSAGQAPQGYQSGSYLRSGGAAGSSPPSDTPPPASYPPASYPSSTPTEGGGYPPGYPQGGPAPGSYPQGGPAPGGYPPGQQLSGYPPGYPQGSYPPPGYPQGGYQGFPAYPDGGIPTAPPGDPLVPGDFSNWFQKIIGVVQRSWRQLGIIQLVIAVVTAIYSAVLYSVIAPLMAYSAELSTGQEVPPPAGLESTMGSFFLVVLGGMVLLGVFSALLYPASMFLVIRDAAGRPASLADAVRFGGGRMPAALGWGILAVVMIVVGTLVFFLPGLYLSIVIGPTLLGVIVVERGNIGRCFTLVHPRFWPTTGRLVILWLIYAFYYFVVQAAATAIGGPLTVTTGILQALLAVPINVFVVGALVVTYAELRFREHPGVTTQALDAEMSR